MLALQLTAKHTKCAQNAQKRHFSAFLAVFLMCALCAIWHFSAFYGCFYAHSMSVHVYTRFLSSAGLPPDTLPLAVQRYDTKTILTNFCVKISQWNAFLGRRLRSLQGESYENRAEGYAICVRSLLHVWPQCGTLTHDSCRKAMPSTRIGPTWYTCHAQRPSHTQIRPHCEPPARYLTNINI